MNQAPPEICAHIFSFACTDSGYTGRSLSLVSKYFHEVSKPAKLQSIALHGRGQILAFAALLDQTPPHLRTTRALLINGRQSEKEKQALIMVAYAPVQPERANGTAYLEEFGAVGARAVECILQHLSPTLELLDVDLSEYIEKMLREPLYLPRLVDLTSRCGFPVRAHPAAPLLAPSPSLRRLHVIENWDQLNLTVRFFEGGISHFAPALTHLRLSRLSHHGARGGTGTRSAARPEVQPPWEPYGGGCPCCDEIGDETDDYHEVVNASRQLRDKDPRVVLLCADVVSPDGHDVYYEEWMRKAGGEEFSWDITGQDLTPPDED
ncbi:hypothetical protein C8J57DRAFT_1519837 [Mycena rebaudengoi]|nr:hypothetical protein C8J57DRAFT_1519837 [Mycena rebaudengoi]